MPQDGNWLEWLASFEVIPPTKVGFSAARKIEFRGETAVFAWFMLGNFRPKISFLFRTLFGEIMLR